MNLHRLLTPSKVRQPTCRHRLRARLATALSCAAAFILAAAWLPSTALASFGISDFKTEAIQEGGSPDTQAGSHPWELSTSVDFKTEGGTPPPGGPFTEGDPRDLHISLPPGLIENPAAINQCSLAQFNTPRVSPFETSQSGESCPDKSQIGTVSVHTSIGGGATRTFGVYDLAPPPGAPSEIGFSPYGVPIVLTPHIRQANGEYGLTLDLRSLSQRFDLYGFTLTLWGTPWNLTHNTERGNCLNEAEPENPWGKCSVGRPRFNPPSAYLTLPASCTGPLSTTIVADSWQSPGAYLPDGEPDLSDPDWKGATSTAPKSLEGCDRLHFEPEALGQPTTARAASPSGYALSFNIEDEGLLNPKLTEPSQPKKAIVTLPNGMTLNPSLAAGLGTCTPAQYAAETVSSPPGAGCPNASKIGDFTVETPLFHESVAGSLFLARPFDNPFNSLLALYIVAKAPERGIMVKVAGKVELDHTTGQLTATFDDLPQLPYAHFKVFFREGQRSPLLTPPSCGAYSTKVTFSPWLDPETQVEESPPLAITSGIEGSACPTGAAPPFTPAAVGGTLNSNAGSYSPFYLHLTRKDTEQEITSYSATLPPGLLGKIAGIPYCPEADIEAAKRETGVGEAERPSCPAASEIGHTVSGYGVGPVLAYAPGRLYLAGPYHGSSFSVVAIDSATVGPFDLGTIIVRSAIEVNPRNAQVSIDSSGSDPIPHIVDGIPIHLRDVRVYISRHELTINPTSCDPFTLSSTLTGSSAPFANPKDISATATVPYQVSNCAALGFAPKFAMKLKGGTRRGDYPTLHATVTPRPGDANIGSAAVTLPPSLFLEQAHIRRPCLKAELEAEACLPEAVYGHATAITPLLGEPMSGPVYLSTAPGNANGLPDLIAVLHAQGIRIVLDGKIDKNRGGIRATFEGLPDAPVSRFEMTINGGKKGILVDSANLCAAPQIATARFIGQNNTGEALRPKIGVRCPKKHHHRGGKG